MDKSIFKFIFFFNIILFVTATAVAQENSDDIVIGKTLKLNSKILNEERNILIYTPRTYERSQESYPVLYMLDGEGTFFFSSAIVNFLSRANRMPQMIVVGIPNTNRDRDFTPTHQADREHTGGADNFLKFMDEELFPFIDNNYRTQPYRVLFGHSLCGMFSIYTLFTKPDLFNAAIASSPSLMYDEEVVVKKVAATLKEKQEFKKFLFINLGEEPNYVETLNKFKTLLAQYTKDLSWKYVTYENNDHASVLLKGLYDGLEFIYSEWIIPGDLANHSYETIDKHYQTLSEKYGYQIKVPEYLINLIGYQLLFQNNIDNAINMFKINVKNYPNSANVYDSLGEGYERNNQLDLALKNYKIAFKKGELSSDPNLPIYKSHVDKLKNKSTEKM